MWVPNARKTIGSFPSAITESASLPTTRNASSDSSNACTAVTNTPERELALPSVSELWNDTAAASGWNPSQGRGRRFFLLSPMDDHHRILIIEDNKADVHLLREAIDAAGIPADLNVISDGEKAIEFIDQIDNGDAPCPALVLLDLNLPRRTGSEILEYLRR